MTKNVHNFVIVTGHLLLICRYLIEVNGFSEN